MILALFAAVVAVLFATWQLTAISIGPLLWGAAMSAILIRLVVAVRENNALLERVRTDQLTGLGNQGGVQVDLAAHCAEASAERPISVALFDLDGFKRYNDTFGHPCGDELLTELGHRLWSVVGEAGGTYRIGGDEFCLILTCEKAEVADLVRSCAAALTTHRSGVSVTASWGVVTVPEEAASPRDALQLADLRMYAQKESRRVARDTPIRFAQEPAPVAGRPLGGEPVAGEALGSGPLDA
jgi:diguanylate cyclase (GGDEF)-like protein